MLIIVVAIINSVQYLFVCPVNHLTVSVYFHKCKAFNLIFRFFRMSGMFTHLPKKSIKNITFGFYLRPIIGMYRDSLYAPFMIFYKEKHNRCALFLIVKQSTLYKQNRILIKSACDGF